MYCGECGTQNKPGSIYCGECGNKLTPIKKEPKVRKKMDMKTKILIGFVIAISIFLSGTVGILYYQTRPARVAKYYIEAVSKKDVDTLYRYMKIDGDKTFITKNIYAELIKDNPDYNIENYKVTDISLGTGDLTAVVTFTYTEQNSAAEKKLNVTLVKQKQNKWLIFPNWKISASEMDNQIVEDFKIMVPKGASINYAGVNVKETYLDDELSTENTDVYVLSQVFSHPTKVTIKLENGYEIEDEVTPSFYKRSYTAKVSLNTISEEEQEKIRTQIKEDLQSLYVGAMTGKNLTEIEHLNYDKENKEELEKDYQALVNSLKKASNTLTNIEFTNVTLSNVSLDEKGNLEFRFKANYKYTVRYLDSGNKEQYKETKGYSYMKLSYSLKKQTYYVVDANDLEDYFSRN